MTKVFRLRYSPFLGDLYPQSLSWLRPTARRRFRTDGGRQRVPRALEFRAPEGTVRAHSAYRRSQQLFVRYPLAVRAANRTGSVRSMVLLVRDSCDTEFYVLLHDRGRAENFYLLKRWRGRCIGSVYARGGADIPVEFAVVVTNGVPIPLDGSLFGWKSGGDVTALLTFHVKYTPRNAEPSWSLMLLADVPQALWPPFIGEPLFGSWFWDHHRAGNIIWLDHLIAATPRTVFWVNTEGVFGSDCCIVTQDVESPKGYTLRRGRYVDCQVVKEGKLVPSLAELLTSPNKTDLAYRF